MHNIRNNNQFKLKRMLPTLKCHIYKVELKDVKKIKIKNTISIRYDPTKNVYKIHTATKRHLHFDIKFTRS